MGYQFEKKRDTFKEMKISTMFKVLPKLQSQMNALLNTKVLFVFPSVKRSHFPSFYRLFGIFLTWADEKCSNRTNFSHSMRLRPSFEGLAYSLRNAE